MANKPSNQLPIISFGNFDMQAALGLVGGVDHIGKFGRNEEIDTAAAEDIIAGGGTYAGQPTDTTPEIIEILHPNGADNSSSTGMKSVTIVGLRTATSTAYTQETITLTGVATDSANTWWRIVSVRGATFGTGGTNAGTITARSKTTTTEIFAVVAAGAGRSQVGVFTSPYNTITAIKNMRLQITRPAAGTGNATVQMVRRASGAGGYSAHDNFDLTTSSPVDAYNNTPMILQPLEDLIVRVNSVSANTTTATVRFDCFLFENTEDIFGLA